LADPALAEAMGAESLKRAQDLCIDRMAQRLVDLYEGLLAERRARRRVAWTGAARVGRQLTRLRRRGRVIMRHYL